MRKALEKIFLFTIVGFLIIVSDFSTVFAAGNPYPEWQTIDRVTTRPCTWYAWKLAYERTGVALPGLGNGGQWYDNAIRNGLSVGSTAVPNSIAVWTGAPAGLGHVGFVESVNNGTMHVLEGGRNDCPSTNGIGSINLSSAVGTKRNYGTQTLVGFIYLTGIQNITYEQLEVTFTDSNNAGLTAWINNSNRMTIPEVGANIWDGAGNQFFATNSNGQISYSEKKTFQTLSPTDTEKPSISNVEIRDLTGTGYTVVCKATDNRGISKVTFPTWTTKNGKDDIIWGNGKKSGDTYSYQVNISAHKRERGNYRTYIYAYDSAENRSIYKINIIYVSTTKNRNVTNGTYEIMSALNNSKVLDIYNVQKTNGTPAILHDRHNGDNQKFKISYYGNGYYKIAAKHSGKALDVEGASRRQGTNLQQYSWNRTSAQLFRFVPAGNGYYYIRSKLGTYVDVQNASTANGTKVWMYTLNRSNAQKWKLIFNGN